MRTRTGHNLARHAKWSKAQCELTAAAKAKGLTPWTPAALAQARYLPSAAAAGGKTSESENTPRAGGLAALGGARL